MQTKRKTMIVTGAAKGVGAGVTNAFIERGYNVVANSLQITASTFAPSERLALVQGDIGDASTAQEIVSTALKTFGSIDGVVNNAGVFFTKAFTEYTAADFDNLSRVNLLGYINLTQLNALDADRDLFQAQLDLARLRLEEILSVVQLYKALGGGWQS